MAEIVQIDIPGIGIVDARNAASEKTLKDILKILEDFDKQILKGKGKNGSGDGDGGGGDQDDKDDKKIRSNFVKNLSFAASAASVFGNATIGVVSNLANLGNSLESVATMFSSIPVAGAMFSAVASASERVVNSFNDVAQSGATFGGSINSFSRSASQAGMTLNEFGSLIRSNGQGMLAFGTTVESGAKRFVQVSRQLRDTNRDLYALGFSTQDINKGLASYGALLRLQGRQGTKSNADLAAGAGRYLKNLDALAKITGEERAAKEAEMQALMQSAQFQASMAGLSEEVRESFMMTVGQLPKGMQKFAEDIMATGTATTEENQKLLAMMPQSAALLTEFNAKQQRGEAISLEERNRLNNLMKSEGGAALQSIKQAGAANAELAPLVNSLASTYQINNDAVKEATAEQKAAKEATDKVNESINKMRERIAGVSNTFQMLLVNSGALDTMMEMFEGLVDIISTLVVPAFNFIAGAVQVLMEVVNVLTPIMMSLGNFIGATVVPVFQTVASVLKDTWFPILAAVTAGFVAYKAVIFVTSGSLTKLAFNAGKATASLMALGLPATKLIIGIAAVVGLFALLYKKGFSFGDVLQGLWDNFKLFGLGFLELFLKIRSSLPKILGGYSKEEEKAAKERLAANYKDLADRKAARAERRTDRIKERGFKDKDLKLGEKQLGQKQEEIRATEKALDLSSPYELLKGLAEKEGSGFVANAESGGVSSKAEGLVANAESGGVSSKAEGSRRTLETEAAQKSAQAAQAAQAPVDSAAQTAMKTQQAQANEAAPAAQETLLAAINRLNTNIEQMVGQQARTNATLNNQLRVQENMAGNMSNDLFHQVGA